ncbi:protein kinase [Histoplasma ohiense]|nr:protein kinase [Histoplasma ohiense (nom. inval.)]
MPITDGTPVLCDFGGARIGERKHLGDVMPDFYRAPEVILGMEWDCKIGIWPIGVMVWDLFEGGRLFYALKIRILDDEQILLRWLPSWGLPHRASFNGVRNAASTGMMKDSGLRQRPFPSSRLTRESGVWKVRTTGCCWIFSAKYSGGSLKNVLQHRT